MARLVSLIAAAVAMALVGFGPAAASGGGDDRRRSTASGSFVEITTLTATITEDFRARGILQVDVGFEIENARQRNRALEVMPRLRAACAEALRAYAGDQYRHGAVPDADRIADLLQAAANRALGHDDSHILLGMVIIHEGR